MLEWQSDQEVYSEAIDNRTTSENSSNEQRPEAGSLAGGVERSDATNEDNADVIFFSSMLEEILDYRNIQKALMQVISNRGAGGIDGMETGELQGWLESHWIEWKESILEGRFRPRAVRKVVIAKPGGTGKQMLGIPCVTDRLLQQAISQWLSPKYEAGSHSIFPNADFSARFPRIG